MTILESEPRLFLLWASAPDALTVCYPRERSLEPITNSREIDPNRLTPREKASRVRVSGTCETCEVDLGGDWRSPRPAFRCRLAAWLHSAARFRDCWVRRLVSLLWISEALRLRLVPFTVRSRPRIGGAAFDLFKYKFTLFDSFTIIKLRNYVFDVYLFNTRGLRQGSSWS